MVIWLFKITKQFFLFLLSEACWWGGGITKEDCEEFEKNEQCEDLYQGRIQTMEMAVELYKVHSTPK